MMVANTVEKRNNNPLSGLSAMVSDIKTQKILRLIDSRTDVKSGDIITTANLSRKEFYSRLERLKREYIVRSSNNKYRFTFFGSHLYKHIKYIEDISNNRYRFVAIEAMKDDDNLTKNDYDMAKAKLLENFTVNSEMLMMKP